MSAGLSGDASKRAAEIYERVLEGANKDKMILLFERFNDCFALSDFELGTTHLFEHEIELADGTKPIAQPGRPVPLALHRPLKEMLELYWQMGVIKPSKSAWSSPVVLVRKKDSSLRMCVDYRRLNKVIKLLQYPMPNINVMLQSLVGKKFFTTCDLHSGYWQIPLSPQAKELTAFSTLGGYWEFNVLPFGLSNAPGGFERAMEKIFEEDLGKTVFIYLDDILIATDTLEEHLQVVEKTETAFLGHVISSEGLKTDAEKIEKILAYPVPLTPSEIRAFLGFCSYYRQFVRNFTLLSLPLRELLSSSQWQWTEKEQNAFDELKRRMSSTPVLAQPDIEAAISGKRPFILYTDASKDGVGAVLHQVGPDGKEHPIAFASKSCSKAERNYAIADLEALALIFDLNKFKYFLLGTHVIARTDHQPLVSLFKRRDLSGRAYRWALEIQEWNNPKIEYISGKKNVVADALRRNVEASTDDNTPATQIKSVVMSIQCDSTWLAKLQEKDWLKEVFQKPEDECSASLKEQDMFVQDGMLYKTFAGRKVLVVPQSETRVVFDRFHNRVSGGHAGWYKTTKMMEKYVYWPSLRQDVKKWIRKCFTCARHKKQRTAVPALKPIVSKRPYELVGIDVFSISPTSSGVHHVVTVIDHHSKFCAAYAVADKSAETISRAFWENWCLREGRMCSTLLSDRGGEFLVMQEIQKLTGLEQKFTVGHNPRENGVTERMNETLKGLLSKMSDGVSEWDLRLAYALLFYSSSPHSTTGESPFFLLHGADANFPVCGVPSTAVSPYTVDLDGYKIELARGMKALHEVTTERIQKQAEAVKRHYDKAHNVEKTQFKLYDRVFVFNPNFTLGSKEIGGSLMDYEQSCNAHKYFKLDVMPVIQPPESSFFKATTAVDLARGAAVAESESMTALDKELFFLGTSLAVVELRLAEPTDDQLVTAMLKMIYTCTERLDAFTDASHVALQCSNTANPEKAGRKVRIAERVRATLDGKSLNTEETTVVGGVSASRFPDALGVSYKPVSASVELRSFLTSHSAATVKRVFVWMDLPDSNVVAEVFISNIATEVQAAAAWPHVVFVIMPPPYNALRLEEFEAFLRHFNAASPELENVLWLDESARWNGYRFSHALDSNELVTDNSSVYDGSGSSVNGTVSGKANEDSLHGVRGGKVSKNQNSSRGAPSRGGGGGFQRGQGYQQRGQGYQQRGQGSQQRGHNQYYRGRGNQSNQGRRQGPY
ncbi:gagpol and env protein precursor [Aphelenchoides avenae]|nr:gagpol and env protein precursor [Aphelenchus avenae]